ncbi:MAG TPA: hypothetical protein VMW65_17985 [Chloroflexota bacterium]|nr:hypothetical protein [Chloroflexota bacterium]
MVRASYRQQSESTHLSLLGFEVSVEAPVEILRALPTVFPSGPNWTLAAPGLAVAAFEVPDLDAEAGRYRILRDGVVCWEGADAMAAVGGLEWAITTAAVERLGERYLLFHSGAVALRGEGILLPAVAGSGKTTLVAGLLAAGFQYLSDEVAVLDLKRRTLLPFPRSLCIKSGSRPVLTPLYPALAAAPDYPRFAGDTAAYLPPPSGSWPAGPVPMKVVVLPRYLAGAPTALVPITRARALQGLLEQSFSARRTGPVAITTAIEVLRDARCYALTVGDLSRAVELLHELV